MQLCIIRCFLLTPRPPGVSAHVCHTVGHVVSDTVSDVSETAVSETAYATPPHARLRL